MVGYGEYTKGYNLFDPSTHKIFIERSVQFEEEIIPDFELGSGECSSPQHQDDVSDDSISDIYDNYMVEYDLYVHESPSRPKWDDKTIETAGDLAGNPLDPRKTRSQLHNASCASEISLVENCYMIIGSDP